MGLQLLIPQAGLGRSSLLPLVNGEAPKHRDYIINHVNGVASGNQFPMRAVQTKTSALIVTPWSDGKNRLSGIDSMSGLTFPAMVEAAKTNSRIKKRVDQYRFGYPMAFYDLVKDPDLRENQIHNPAYREEIQRLQDILLNHMITTRDPQLENYRTILAGGTGTVQIVPARRQHKQKTGGE